MHINYHVEISRNAILKYGKYWISNKVQKIGDHGLRKKKILIRVVKEYMEPS